MSMVASVRLLQRAPRRHVQLSATLRRDQQPFDVIIVDLSATGLRLKSAVALKVSDQVRVGWAGGHGEDALVVWAKHPDYGAMFRHRLPAAALSAGAIDNVVAIEPANSGPLYDDDLEDRRLRLKVGWRALAIVGAAAGSWGIVAAIGWAVASL